jgi:2-octaprenyl-3-methyl-6-methoxy-1,4-benzoquinol hydroxylase (EC 1.14.13.-)
MECAMLDMLVVGGGYVGLSVALAVKQAAPHLSVEVVEAAPQDAWKKDPRASAIIAAAIRMLEVFGIWERIEPEAQPITKMIVTDSKTADPVRPVFLTFDGAVEDGRPFAYMIPNVAMVGALRDACAKAGVTIRHGLRATGLENSPAAASVTLSDGTVLSARLVVACDGVRSKLRDMAGIKTVTWDYGQSGIVTTVEHERPHEGLRGRALPSRWTPLPSCRSRATARPSYGPSALTRPTGWFPPMISSSRKNWSAASDISLVRCAPLVTGVPSRSA